ncbi:MAG: carboxymuconolactone decarboxylase family protein, partial [Methylomicrobium sp.]|nr:carboxymuconolactone decarboxylase family protein [Methylomicrobium sp.]
MSLFKIHSIEQAPTESRPLLTGAHKKFGFVPNLLGELSEAPATLEAYLTLNSIFDKTSLSPVERQIVLIAASIENDCTYCVAVHSIIAKNMVKADARIIDALRKQNPIPDEKLQALVEFTQKIVEQRGFVDEQTLNAFIDAGYSNRQVLEVIFGVAFKTLSNYANHVMETPLDDK